jgi:DUF4097 and DUF4098 domain-containing protein YvlB
MRKFSFYLAVVLPLLAADSLSAARFAVADRSHYTFPLQADGTFSLHNPAGNVEIIGVDAKTVTVTADRIVQAASDALILEGRRMTPIIAGGNDQARVIRTNTQQRATSGWTSAVNYQVRLPRTASVRLDVKSSDTISVANISGPVFISNNRGSIRLQNVTGPQVTVETINGSIVLDAALLPQGNVTLATVNGNVLVAAAADANFNWLAESIGGTFNTNFAVHKPRWSGPRFEGVVNAGGRIIRTVSLMGSVTLLQRGTRQADARRVLPTQNAMAQMPGQVQPPRDTYLKIVNGNFLFRTNLGNIRIDEARGAVTLETGAGEVHLGSVRGFADVLSLGGPIRLGDVSGEIRANTKAGDIQVQAARSGGVITTGGGLIRLLYAGGPTRLQSGGGDITVRQANSPINALTRSGDISITMDAGTRSQRIYAKTGKGSVAFNVNSRFGADIDATVITSDPDTNNIRSDMPGLNIQREQVDGKTRIRATGKINGGGERVELVAEDGGIQILSSVPGPTTAAQR